MSATTRGGDQAVTIPRPEPVTLGKLDRAALATGAAERRARLREIEADMDQACEAAVRRVLQRRAGDRAHWDRHAWSVYVQEAVAQAMRHAAAVARLRREADHLDHLAGWAS